MTGFKKVHDDEYDIIDQGEENFHRIVLKEDSPYFGVTFQFGEVKLLEENNRLRVKFEYEVFENFGGFDTKSEEFVNYIGDILMTNLSELLMYNKYQREQGKSGN